VPQLFDNICFAEKSGFDPESCHEVIDEHSGEKDCTYMKLILLSTGNQKYFLICVLQKRGVVMMKVNMQPI
jgi:hypothetical protein